MQRDRANVEKGRRKTKILRDQKLSATCTVSPDAPQNYICTASETRYMAIIVLVAKDIRYNVEHEDEDWEQC